MPTADIIESNCEDDDVSDEFDKHEGREKDKTESKRKRVIYYFDTDAKNEGKHICNCNCVTRQDEGENWVF